VKIERYKYPRTPHLPWSLSVTSDDKVLQNIDHFLNKQVIVTEKRDGENTTWYRDYTHARSIDSNNHPSRNINKRQWNDIRHEIPESYRICGENLYAKHSIYYKNLSSYFEVFSIWNQDNVCLSWNDTIEWCALLKLQIVPVIYKGIFDESLIKTFKLDLENTEGYVIRLSEAFTYKDFSKSVAKFVRSNHVQTSEHWTNEKIIPNILSV
jgi:hypothetical protein